MIKLIKKKKEWDTWVSNMDFFDFYHTYDYHTLFLEEDTEAVLIAYKEGDVQIGIPMIKRNLENGYYDLTSVHGYLGPMCKKLDPGFNNEDFLSELKNLLLEENIVSVFSKLNPYIPHQDQILKGCGNIEKVGELVYFLQTDSEADQYSAYNRNTRQSLKKLKKSCEVKLGDFSKDVETFISYYYKSLDRLKAKPLFYFKKNYFNQLAQSVFSKSEILFAVNSETQQIMAGVLVVQTNNIAQVELAFIAEEFFKCSPLRLLFDECRQRYKNMDIKVLNLGGGRGGREGSLMKFKSSFSKKYADFQVWKYIAIPDVYHSMVSTEQKNHESNFFPKYRLKTA